MLLGRTCVRQDVGYIVNAIRIVGMSTGGSPRAFRAWPLAWPSPSGPLGRQRLRRSRAGALDAGGADLDNARRSVPVAVTFRTAIGALGASVTAWPCPCGAALGRDGGDRLRPVPGQPCAAARRAVELPPEGRDEKLPPGNGETPGDPCRLSPVTRPLYSSPVARASSRSRFRP
jgi:hypothetical protein